MNATATFAAARNFRATSIPTAVRRPIVLTRVTKYARRRRKEPERMTMVFELSKDSPSLAKFPAHACRTTDDYGRDRAGTRFNSKLGSLRTTPEGSSQP